MSLKAVEQSGGQRQAMSQEQERWHLRWSQAFTRAFALSVCLQAGCVSYRPMPLEGADVQSASLSKALPALRTGTVVTDSPLLRCVAIDPTDGFSPDELAALAVLLNPTLRGVRDRAAVAEAQADQSTLLPNPVLGFSLDTPVGANTSGSVPGYGLSLEWEITSLLTYGAKKAAATQTAAQGRLDTAWQEWQVAQAARQSAYDVLALRRQRSATRALADRLQHVADAAQQALARHDLTATDASTAVAAAGEARVTLAAVERDLADARITLCRSVGVSADEPLPLDERAMLPSRLQVPDASTLLEHLSEHRIDLVALRRGYDSQEATVRGAVLGQFPRISLGISHTRDTGDFFTVGPALSVTLPVFDRNQGVIAIETATRQQLFDEYHTRVFEARSDVARAVQSIRSIDRQIATLTGQVRTLEQLVTSDERALGEGNLDAATYYTAAVSLAQRQADLAKLQQELMRGLITLELAAGVDLPVGN